MTLEHSTVKPIRTGRVGRGVIGSVLSGRLGWTLISFFALIALWAIVAAILQSRLFPGPLAVGDKFFSEAASGELFYHVGVTLARVAVAFLLAMFIGSAIGMRLGAPGRAHGAVRW